MEKYFIAPKNDLEAVSIISMLKENGYVENRDFWVTEQEWGASWDGLESNIKEAIKDIPPQYIYGIELQGDSPYNNIDHHIYENEDRSNNLSSIEQTAELIGHRLTKKEMFISENDKAYIPGMKKLAKELNLPAKETDRIISEIRYEDRSVQGITPEQERQAEEAIKNMEYINGYDIVHLPHSKCATVTDRLFEISKNTLIICGDGELDFYGDSSTCLKLQEQLGGWAGGTQNPTGFWGNYTDPQNAKNILNSIYKKHTVIMGRSAVGNSNRIDTSPRKYTKNNKTENNQKESPSR